MDRLIIQGIKRMHVFKPYFYNKMDDLARDLNKALDESFDPRPHEGKVKRSRSWRCRSKSKSCLMLSSSVPKSSAKSEDSESSLDNWLQQKMDFSTCSYQPTDSDDIKNVMDKESCYLTSWRHCEDYVGESDSVNENLNPYREPKRRRKFKRMSIDPPSVLKHEFSSLPSVSSFSQRCKRSRNIRSQKFSKLLVKSPKLSKVRNVSYLSSEMQNICKGFRNVATSSGKRKRCFHERSLECSGSDCKEFASSEGVNSRFSSSPYQFENIGLKSLEINSSGLSSSESDCELFTNDESREADDEQSDFYQECDFSGEVPSLWKDGELVLDETLLTRNRERQIKSGRRQLGKGVVPCTDLLSCLPVKAEDKIFSAEGCLTKLTSNKKKKRKGMPTSGSIFGYTELKTHYSESHIPESSLGYQVLKKMGWKTGTGMCQLNKGVLSSAKPALGLNFSKEKDNIVLPNLSFSKSISQAPPPPPSSPESVFMRNENSS